MEQLRDFASDRVSLFVRLWVEMYCDDKADSTFPSASSWGCELKYMSHALSLSIIRQPLREAVSWNTIKRMIWNSGKSSASSWGCELKLTRHIRNYVVLMSASSWGCELKFLYPLPEYRSLSSASSWGCELKCVDIIGGIIVFSQPLREAVSWNDEEAMGLTTINRQPLREAVSWNNNL